jgi:predicted SAM-dependent methyltransferase
MGIKRLAHKLLGERGRETLVRAAGTAAFHARKAFSKNGAGDRLRLHLGCGDVRLPGFVNVDANKTFASDVIDDLTKLENFCDESADEIYVCHVLEHFAHDEVPPLLKRWHAVLKPGGVIRISVPDLDRIVRIYAANWDHFQKDGHSPWIGLIYGGQKDKYDFHKTGFNQAWLRRLLTDAGFVDAQEYPLTPHFCGAEVVDASLSSEPFGEMFSLNMMATKPTLCAI